MDITYILETIVELGLLVGIAFVIMSFFDHYRKHRVKLLIGGIVLIALGIIFIDWSAAIDAFQRGKEAAQSSVG